MLKTRMQHVHWRPKSPRLRPLHPGPAPARMIQWTVALLTLQLVGCQALQGDTGAYTPAPTSPLAAQAVQILEYGLSNPDPRVRSSAIESIVQTRYTQPDVDRLTSGQDNGGTAHLMVVDNLSDPNVGPR